MAMALPPFEVAVSPAIPESTVDGSIHIAYDAFEVKLVLFSVNETCAA
jgi:hypothetical protein